MKQDILSRYDTHTGRRLAIDVSVGRIEELFEDFDSAASYVKKDLDQDFVEYLIECVREISRYDFVIRINLPAPVQENHRKRVRKSIKYYFRYLELLERRKLRRVLWRSFLLFCLGMFLLIISLNIRGSAEQFGALMQELLVEGLTVAAWVSLWTAFASLIFELTGIISDIRIYRRIAGLQVIFKTSNFSKAFNAKDIKEDKVAV
ncbi:MAG: hypothetical protein JRF02_00685 [Deltaproteobacteria bacterium]|nr:hypothetical protein [Deltaproteobacteria bacterium]